jgi:hypothetical protein
MRDGRTRERRVPQDGSEKKRYFFSDLRFLRLQNIHPMLQLYLAAGPRRITGFSEHAYTFNTYQTFNVLNKI